MTSKLTAVSLFSGCGGFDWGAQQVGVEIIWANDIDPHAVAAYRALFPHVECIMSDVRDIPTFPQADILIGCYPCTGFSVAARRRWRDSSDRDLLGNDGNFLYREFLRALKQVRPKYLFVENVRGMVTAVDGWFFEQQLQGFRDQGYTVQYTLLNTTNYGLPQSRRRIFIVGVRNDIRELTYEFPQQTHGLEGQSPFVVLRDAIAHMPEWPEGEYFDRSFHGHYLTRNRKRAWDDVSYTIVANAHHVPLHPMGEPMKFIKKDTWILQGQANRRLSWRESAMIQGLPPNFAPPGNLMDKYRIVGNAVPPIFGKVLLESIVRFES